MTHSEERIGAWASENDFALQSIVPKSLGQGNPWGLWGTGRGTRFFQVTIIDPSGSMRVGWVRIRAGWMIGSGKLDVRWQQ
jgi:hypothetical protein